MAIGRGGGLFAHFISLIGLAPQQPRKTKVGAQMIDSKGALRRKPIGNCVCFRKGLG